jgi:Fic family protein
MQSILTRIDEKKKKLDLLRPLPPELVHSLYEWSKIELTYTSNALEGNTLTASETAIVVEKGITIGGKTVREHLEAINHAHAVDYMMTLAHKNKSELTLDDILAIHVLILKYINDAGAGRLRNVKVYVKGTTTVFPAPDLVPQLMNSFFQWLYSTSDHPVKIAADAHFKFVTIHPFIDGNGRTARLLMNLLLVQTGYPITIIGKEERAAYINALKKGQENNDLADFYALIFSAVERSLDMYLQAAAKV